MDPRNAYNLWAAQYDTNENRTRDLEAISLREMLAPIQFDNCLELGCGTGKNTEWLMSKAAHIVAADYSEEMLAIAKRKIKNDKVEFVWTDLNKEWSFKSAAYDLVIFSLVLEHIEDLDMIMQKASNVLIPGGYVYIGELHPFKQYGGSKARFETNEGLQIVQCYTHHVSDFTKSAAASGLSVVNVREYFDDDNRNTTPRILSILFRKSK